MAFNLGAGLGALGAFSQGTRDYDVYQRQKQAQDQKIAMDKIALQQAQDAQQRNPDVAKGLLELYGQQAPQVPPPPVQPPMPGQPSVPMQQPAQYQAQPRPMGPDPYSAADQKYGFPPGTMRSLAKTESNGDPHAVSPRGATGIFQMMPATQRQPGFGLPPLDPNDPMAAGAYLKKMIQLSGGDVNLGLARYNAGPAGNLNNPETVNYVKKFHANLSGGQQRQQVPPQMQGQQPPQAPQGQQQPMQGQGQPQQQPPIAPYQSMANVGQQPQQQPSQIGAPPKLDFDGAIKILNAKGITDPQTVISILEKNQARLTGQAQQQLAYQKEVQAEQDRHDKIGNDNQYHQDMVRVAGQRADTGQQNADTNATRYKAQADISQKKYELSEKRQSNPDAKLAPDDVKFMASQALAGDKSIFQNMGRGAQGPENIIAVRREITKQAKEQGISPSELAAINAEFKGIESGERALGTRSANVGMAASAAEGFAKNALAASEKVDRTKYPDFNRILLAGEKKTGDKDVVSFGVYNNSLINAYARAINPNGAATVSDKDHAREMLETAYSKGQYQSAVDAILQEIETEKKAPGSVRKEFRDAVTGGSSSLNNSAPVFSNAAELQAAIKSGKIKKGGAFNDPDGNPHTVN